MLVLIFSFSAPVGIAIGIGIHSSYDANSATANIIQGTLEAVSAGILLYVAFVSLLGEVLKNPFGKLTSFKDKNSQKTLKNVIVHGKESLFLFHCGVVQQFLLRLEIGCDWVR